MRTFDPSIGKNYGTPTIPEIRINVLGEAHHGDLKNLHRNFTREMVKLYGQQKRLSFFTKVWKLICGAVNRAEFWENIAFYNYIQTFPGPSARIRPTTTMWEDAIDPFLKTVEELKPQLLVILGHELYNHVPTSILPKDLVICPVQHPSSWGFRYCEWQPRVQEAINEALSRNRSQLWADR